MILLPRNTIGDVDWANPVNFGDSLNRGLVAWFLAAGHIRGSRWPNLCHRRSSNMESGELINMDPATDWAGSIRRGGFGALDFDAASSQVVQAYSSSFVEPYPLTLSCWFTFPSTSGIYSLNSLGNSASQREQVLVVVNGQLYALSQVGSNFQAISNLLPTNTWLHGVGVYESAASRKVFINGELKATNNSAAAMLGYQGFWVGARQRSTPIQYHDGAIDDCRWWKRALTDAEIKEVYLDSLRGHPRTLNRLRVQLGKPTTTGGSSVLDESISLSVTVDQSQLSNAVIGESITISTEVSDSPNAQVNLQEQITLALTVTAESQAGKLIDESIALATSLGVIHGDVLVAGESVLLAVEAAIQEQTQVVLDSLIGLGVTSTQAVASTAIYQETLTLAVASGLSHAGSVPSTIGDILRFVSEALTSPRFTNESLSGPTLTNETLEN